MKTKVGRVILLVMLGLGMFVSGGYAIEEPSDYAGLSARKLGRGLSNTFFGWVELPGGIEAIGEKHGVGAAATWGLLHGLGRAVQRTAIGVFEVITFPFGTPQHFEPLIEPEFVLSEE